MPFELGLDGHSDADIVCHAVTDAVLGAAAAGDIGRLFPDTDPAWKDADSLALLRQARGAGARRRLRRRQRRRHGRWRSVPSCCPTSKRCGANLAGALAVDASCVSVKGKTNEGVDSMGRGESMACHAVALLVALSR